MANQAQRLLVTGATGLVGRAVCLEALKRGYDLVVIGRRSETDFRADFSLPCQYIQWKNFSELPGLAIEPIDHVIHLMGEPIADGRWTESRKKLLWNSRVHSTQALAQALKAHQSGLKTFLSASAIGIYPEGGSPFLSDLCQAWERASHESPGRVVNPRIGIVLSRSGGALSKMVPLFESGLGGKLGDGSQWMSWIHLDDLVGSFFFAIENESVSGPYDAVAPNPVTNQDFTEALARTLKTWAPFPAPKIALKIALGEMAAILLASQKLAPNGLLSHGFKFKFPDLQDALNSLFEWKEKSTDRLFYAQEWIAKPQSKLFQFFSDERNLERITPPFLNFKVLGKSTPHIERGTEINYKLRIHGIPAGWRTLISEWNPPHHFRDIQLNGPYAKWDHTHRFIPIKNGTLMEDQVVYRLPLASWGGSLAGSFVRKDIHSIFNYRKSVLKTL